MAETKAQKVKRLQREIDSLEEQARQREMLAEKKREALVKIANRPSEPEGDDLRVRVQFNTTAKVYTYLIRKTPVGYFTTGTGTQAMFHTWDNLLDWLDSDDVRRHSGIEVLTGTGEVAYPQRSPYAFGDMGLGGDYDD